MLNFIWRMLSTQKAVTFLLITASIAALIHYGATHALTRLSLTLLFSALMWFRSEIRGSRWVALGVLWSGYLILSFGGHALH